nr:MAG TPA: hypothetical protein [Crassvirales sp.]
MPKNCKTTRTDKGRTDANRFCPAFDIQQL